MKVDQGTVRPLESLSNLQLMQLLAAADEEAARAAEAAEAAKAAKAKEAELARQKEAEERQIREWSEVVSGVMHVLQKQKVESWCSAHGFAAINSKKKAMMGGFKFPLHKAVEKKDEEMVALMMLLGADKSVKNSKGETPESLAHKLNEDGSMNAILAELQPGGAAETLICRWSRN